MNQYYQMRLWPTEIPPPTPFHTVRVRSHRRRLPRVAKRKPGGDPGVY